MVRLVVITVDALVRKAVREELAAVKPPAEPSDVMTRAGVAELLQVTSHHVTTLMRRGMPAIRFGRHGRFRRSEVLAWMTRQQPREVRAPQLLARLRLRLARGRSGRRL